MDIVVSKYAGFCGGVRRADEAIKGLIASRPDGGLIFTIGPLIHNEIYNEELRKCGVLSVSIDDVPRIVNENPNRKLSFVIRTHGIEKSSREYLEGLAKLNPDISVVDMTCPSVRRIQKIAEDITSERTHFVLFGSKSHAEVKAAITYANGDKTVISSPEEAERLEIGDKIPILCSQTTQNLLLFVKIKKIFKKRFTNAQIFDTICSVTENRQSEALSLARECDAMIVIGSQDSSNTKKLYELCKTECENTHLISAHNCPPITLSGDIKKVGITAGASTPDGIILEVYKSYGKL